MARLCGGNSLDVEQTQYCGVAAARGIQVSGAGGHAGSSLI